MKPEVPGYRIRRELGKGGMGMVYLAERESDGEPVALKILPPNLLTPVTTRRFQREGQALRALDHPNIVEVFEVGSRQGNHFIAMEYVKGRPLSGLITDHPSGLPMDQAMGIAWDVAGALEAIHAAGMTHRDLKPGNVMVTDSGDVRLLDFGLVQMDGLTMLTATGNIIGTPTYMSPEQCSGRTLDARSDVYSFGILLYEMLCGEPPFASEAVYDLLELQRKASPTSLKRRRKEVPPALEQIVLQCLEKAPEHRPESIREVRERLGHEPRPTPVSSTRHETRRGKFPGRTLAGVTVVLLVAATLFLAVSDLPRARAVRERLQGLTRPFSSTDLRERVQEEFQKLSRAEALADRGRVHQENGEWPQAYRAYVDAIRIYDRKPQYYHALVVLGKHVDREDEVRGFVVEYLDARGDDPGGILARWSEEQRK